ncbi:MAG: recombinase family protein [Trueperaceae bacterium]|nr:recombinase family protein [Trueperaceae bacterium]
MDPRSAPWGRARGTNRCACRRVSPSRRSRPPGALAEFERELIQERTRAGLAAARARGRKGGRPRKLDAKKLATARRLLGDPE